MKLLWLIDWKSSKAVYDEYKMQLAAYDLAYQHLDNILTLSAPRLGILRLDKETGMPEFVDCSDDSRTNQLAFLSLREYYRLKMTDEPKKFYSYQDKKFPSVTAILDILSKPALPQWAANETILYFLENLEELKSAEQERINYIFKKAKTAYRQVSKKALDIGTIVHDAIECYLSGGKPEEIIGKNEKAETAFLAFLEWKDKIELEPIFLEKQLIDPIHEFGGTVDFIGWANIE